MAVIEWDNLPDGFRQAKERAEARKAAPDFVHPNDRARSVEIMENYRKTAELELEREKTALQREMVKKGVPIPPPTDPSTIVLEWAMPKHVSSLKLEYLVDPFLPTKCVVGFYGRGSTAKSSFLATLAARISDEWSTLWISVEELTDWITQRHLHAGGECGTLAAFAYNAIKRDSQGRVVGSTFDVYRDLEGAIRKAQEGVAQTGRASAPLHRRCLGGRRPALAGFQA